MAEFLQIAAFVAVFAVGMAIVAAIWLWIHWSVGPATGFRARQEETRRRLAEGEDRPNRMIRPPTRGDDQAMVRQERMLAWVFCGPAVAAIPVGMVLDHVVDGLDAAPLGLVMSPLGFLVLRSGVVLDGTYASAGVAAKARTTVAVGLVVLGVLGMATGFVLLFAQVVMSG